MNPSAVPNSNHHDQLIVGGGINGTGSVFLIDPEGPFLLFVTQRAAGAI